MPTTWVLIPSRMASTRFPNKPLADVGGKPMVVRVVEQAVKAGVGQVWVAAGDKEIADAVHEHGHNSVMTDAALANGSDRIWQAAQRLIGQGHNAPDIIINAQGDEPLLPPELLTEAVAILNANDDVDVVTFAHPIESEADINNPTKVKAVTTGAGRALYFSRSPIPHGAASMLRHIGFYAYRFKALEKYVSTPPGELENIEKLEQLRGLELGLHYHVATTHHEPIGVDTPADLVAVQKLFKA
ncbi:MAG TPA: 3-deoxy-manno-octulosonate cytidylyltransferase [Alphaproteobacteria bacterium]|nr:3-deoxy-manno-octulosonate cytidylyltransferase [Alphaproteobacteria bacterium]